MQIYHVAHLLQEGVVAWVQRAGEGSFLPHQDAGFVAQVVEGVRKVRQPSAPKPQHIHVHRLRILYHGLQPVYSPRGMENVYGYHVCSCSNMSYCSNRLRLCGLVKKCCENLPLASALSAARHPRNWQVVMRASLMHF